VPSQKNSKLTLFRKPQTQSIVFDEEQRKVITHRGSPLVVLGGPGVGKSASLVARAQSYIADGLDPDQLLVLTYDRHRASELNDQIFAESKRATSGSLVKNFSCVSFCNSSPLSGPSREKSTSPFCRSRAGVLHSGTLSWSGRVQSLSVA